MKIIVTGGLGFIGSHLVEALIADGHMVINIDKQTYAANKDFMPEATPEQYQHYRVDITDSEALTHIYKKCQPDAVFHLAAESHVDRSINSADDFIQTNIVGTYVLLKVSKNYWYSLSAQAQPSFRFIHVSTDEVYGDIDPHSASPDEQSRYLPSSPYSASKAASDHLAHAWYRTYGLPTITTHCSNNYGPRQHYEKFIPTIISNALAGTTIPIYGDGQQSRDWLHVTDHVNALRLVLEKGKVGNSYNIASGSILTNLELCQKICSILDKQDNETLGRKQNYSQLITFVPDRLGHDRRYALNADKTKSHINWIANIPFIEGLEQTVRWYKNNSYLSTKD